MKNTNTKGEVNSDGASETPPLRLEVKALRSIMRTSITAGTPLCLSSKQYNARAAFD